METFPHSGDLRTLYIIDQLSKKTFLHYLSEWQNDE